MAVVETARASPAAGSADRAPRRDAAGVAAAAAAAGETGDCVNCVRGQSGWSPPRRGDSGAGWGSGSMLGRAVRLEAPVQVSGR
jgi:hypothetical protein